MCVASSRLLETDAGLSSTAMDVDTSDSVPGINAGDLALNGVVKADDLQTAIINKVLLIITVYHCYGCGLVLININICDIFVSTTV